MILVSGTLLVLQNWNFYLGTTNYIIYHYMKFITNKKYNFLRHIYVMLFLNILILISFIQDFSCGSSSGKLYSFCGETCNLFTWFGGVVRVVIKGTICYQWGLGVREWMIMMNWMGVKGAIVHVRVVQDKKGRWGRWGKKISGEFDKKRWKMLYLIFVLSFSRFLPVSLCVP